MFKFIFAVSLVFLESWLFMLLAGMFAGYLALPGLALGFWAVVGINCMAGIGKGLAKAINEA